GPWTARPARPARDAAGRTRRRARRSAGSSPPRTRPMPADRSASRSRRSSRRSPRCSPSFRRGSVRAMDDAPTLYTGGRVLVLDGATPPAAALVVRDGRVAGIGDEDAMVRLAGKAARRVSVRGATIMPGLIDTHPHLLHFGAFAEPLVDLADARDHDDIVARIAARAARTPPGEWIMTTPV